MASRQVTNGAFLPALIGFGRAELIGLVLRVCFSITNKQFLNMGGVVRARPHETDMVGS